MQLVFSRAPKLAKKVRVHIGFPVVRTDGRSVTRSVGHVITKFSGMGRFIYPWCSAGAPRARSSAITVVTDQSKVLKLSVDRLNTTYNLVAV